MRSAVTKRVILWAWILAAGAAPFLRAENAGDSVVVVYNNNVSESRILAEYYASRRQVPKEQIFGLDLPKTETMTRAEFREQLQKPLLEKLEKAKLFSFRQEIQPATKEKPGEVVQLVTETKVRYAALCYGVPLKILSDPNVKEEGMERIRVELRRNEAAVDSELALLPLSRVNLPLTGPFQNRWYGATNAANLNPTNGLLMVTRLDGPSFQAAKRLVDLAIQAETDGLWGRAYFDTRGLTNSNYKLGDNWIKGAGQVARRLGFETIFDESPGTFSASYPMSQIALYAGWYDGHVSGPFSRPKVEFMPGAVAYHLHSFSAQSIRSASQNWVGPLLEKGVTATLGCVEEPYLEGTPDVATLFSRLLLFGFSFGEAAYACQGSLSWQTTVIGDPLYRPFHRKPQALYEDLARRHSPLIEWSQLQIVNLNQVTGMPPADLTDYLRDLPETKTSAVLEEKLGDLYHSQGKLMDAIDPYSAVLKLNPTPQQRVRVMLGLARLLGAFSREEQAYELYRQFLSEFPDYPDLVSIYKKILPLAEKLGKMSEAEELQKEINRLTPPPAGR